MYIDTQHKLLHYAKTLAEINQLLNLDDFSDSEVNHEDYLAIFDDKVSTLPKLNLNKHNTYKEFKYVFALKVHMELTYHDLAGRLFGMFIIPTNPWLVRKVKSLL